jgi:predicted XRE-type DNA-binding protein
LAAAYLLSARGSERSTLARLADAVYILHAFSEEDAGQGHRQARSGDREESIHAADAMAPMRKMKRAYESVWDALADTAEQAANLRARADLMRRIAEMIEAEGWKQVEAAERCGVTQPRINDLLRVRVSRFSLDALVNIATALGRRVRVELEAA